MTETVPAARHATSMRALHWLSAALVFATLLIGFTMVSSTASYSTLIVIHKTLGVTILVVTALRLGNRIFHRLPALPATVGSLELRLVEISEYSMYGLLLAQPLVGWAMVSAAGSPVTILGSVRLPRIAPFDADLYGLLRQAHTVLAIALVVVIAAHVSAVLLHSVTLRDGMLRRMTFRITGRK
ncbi:cytochrome b [Mycobacterium sp. NPDC003449]